MHHINPPYTSTLSLQLKPTLFVIVHQLAQSDGCSPKNPYEIRILFAFEFHFDCYFFVYITLWSYVEFKGLNCFHHKASDVVHLYVLQTK